MGNLEDVLKRHAKRHGIERQVEAVGVVERAQKEFGKYVNQDDFEVVSFNRGVLKIRTTSSIVANELKLREKIITKNLPGEVSKVIYSH